MRHRVLIYCFLSVSLTISCSGDRLAYRAKIPRETYPETGFLWGFMSDSGSVVIPANFDEVRDFHEGLAAYRKDYLWGYLNHEGHEVIKPNFLQAHSFSNHLARVVTTDGRTIFIDPFGKSAFDLRCSKAGNFHNNRAPVWIKHKVGYIDTTGQIAIEPKYEDGFEFYLNTAIVKSNGKYGLIDPYGKFILHPTFDLIYFDKNAKDNLCLFKKNGLVGYYNLSSEEYLPVSFRDGQPFYRNTAVIQKDSLYGVIDNRGHFVLMPSFPELMNLGLNRWALLDEGFYFMIDQNGLQYGEGFNQIYRFSEGLATAKIDHNWGFVDTTGSFVINPTFNIVWPFRNGIARIGTDSGVGFIDREGNYVITPLQADIRDFHEGLARYSVHQ